LALAVGAYVVLRWRFARLRRQLAVSTPGLNAQPLATPPAVEGSASLAKPIGPEPTRAPSVATSVTGSDGRAPALIPAVRLSRRVLGHLARLGDFGQDPARASAATQRGMGAALGVTQGALSSVLRRLEDAGAIASEKAHVRGHERRVKVSVLTTRGQQLWAAVPPDLRNGAASLTAPADPSATNHTRVSADPLAPLGERRR
jgi:DNA-binding MarR family transcriptional regulator